ncbi:flagellar hook-length control protein FliK [Acidithiobacillus sp. IBUN Pt1247-S3]|uniref:flagellar hook-length control protein FliK n=1 Tax=Acidithiobacillus sp. IBUN Pt1247-S3 TaxID=3166642 RepID=UPI0034E37AFD
MSMLPVNGLAAPEHAVSASAKSDASPSNADSGFAQVLSQHSEKSTAMGESSGNEQVSASAGKTGTANQPHVRGDVKQVQEKTPEASTAAPQNKSASPSEARKDPSALAANAREVGKDSPLTGAQGQQAGLLVGVPAWGVGSVQKSADQAVSAAATKRSVKDGKDTTDAGAGASAVLPVFAWGMSTPETAPEAQKGSPADGEKSSLTGGLLRDALRNRGSRVDQGSIETMQTNSPATISSFRPLLAAAMTTNSPNGLGVIDKPKSLAPNSSTLPNATNLVGILQMPQVSGNIASPAQLQLAPSLQEQPAWGQALGQSVQWMSQGGVQQAIIHIHPEHLGPLVVQLELGQNGQASAMFLSAHAEVRAAITAAVPQLQQNFAAMGLNLGQASVGSGWSGSAGERRDERAAGEPDEKLVDGVAPLLSGPTAVAMHQGLLSTFV